MIKKKRKSNIDVLLMSDNGLDTVGGEQESTKIIIGGVKKEYNLGVIQPGNIEKPLSGVHYYPLTNETRIKHLIKKPLAFMNYVKEVIKIIRRENPMIIHTQAQVSLFIVSLLRKFKCVPKDIVLIHTERGLYTKYNTLLKNIFFFFMKELNTLVTTTEFNMKYWENALEKKKYQLNYKVIENTAGKLFEIYDKTLERSKDDKLVLGFAGRYADWKNWPLAEEISKKIHNNIGDKLVVKMAVGCLDKQSEIKTIKMFNRMNNLLGNKFEGRMNIGIEEMNRFYYEIDIFILTSNYNTESFGRTLIEAMSRKTVVLTTNSGGSVEVIGNKLNVCKNSNQFVNRIFQYYSSNELMKSEVENNLKRVKSKYSLWSNINKHNDLYLRNNLNN